jgi:hypothetical protein
MKVEDKISLELDLEIIKKDLAFQLTFEEFDWDYFMDVVQEGQHLSQKLKQLQEKG